MKIIFNSNLPFYLNDVVSIVFEKEEPIPLYITSAIRFGLGFEYTAEDKKCIEKKKNISQIITLFHKIDECLSICPVCKIKMKHLDRQTQRIVEPPQVWAKYQCEICEGVYSYSMEDDYQTKSIVIQEKVF